MSKKNLSRFTLKEGWGEILAVSHCGKYIAAASTGRLYLWKEGRNNPTLVMLPGFQKGPVYQSHVTDLLYAGVYQYDFNARRPIRPDFNLLKIVSSAVGLDENHLSIDLAVWHTAGTKFFFQVAATAIKSIHDPVSMSSLKAWFGFLDAQTQTLIHPLVEVSSFNSIRSCLPMGNRLVVTKNQGLEIYDFETGHLAHAYTNDTLRYGGLAVNALHTKVACTLIDETVQVFDASLKKGTPFKTSPSTSYPKITFHPINGHLYVGCENEIALYDLRQPDQKIIVTHTKQSINALTFSPDGKRLIIASGIGGDVIEVMDMGA